LIHIELFRGKEGLASHLAASFDSGDVSFKASSMYSRLLRFVDAAFEPITSSKNDFRTLFFAAFFCADPFDPLEIEKISSELRFRLGRLGGPMHAVEEADDNDDDNDDDTEGAENR